MLASGTQDRGFDPGRSRRIFRAKKSTACLPWGGGVKPSPMSQICAACQGTLGLRGSRNHCLECSVSEPYRSPDWALVPAKNRPSGWILMMMMKHWTRLSTPDCSEPDSLEPNQGLHHQTVMCKTKREHSISCSPSLVWLCNLLLWSVEFLLQTHNYDLWVPSRVLEWARSCTVQLPKIYWLYQRLEFGSLPISAALWEKCNKALCDRARYNCFSIFRAFFTEWHPWNVLKIWRKYRYIQITWYLSFLTLHKTAVSTFQMLLGSCWHGQATFYLFQKHLCWACK